MKRIYIMQQLATLNWQEQKHA